MKPITCLEGNLKHQMLILEKKKGLNQQSNLLFLRDLGGGKQIKTQSKHKEENNKGKSRNNEIENRKYKEINETKR